MAQNRGPVEQTDFAESSVVSGPSSECVFCTRDEQPAILFETPSLYAMPDRYPLLPGHILIISKEHRRCYAQAPRSMDAELEEASARVRRFLMEEYGTVSLAWENGAFGQTVYHAHLHLIPVRNQALPPEVVSIPAISRIDCWEPVRAEFVEAGGYRYFEVGGERWMISGRGVLGPIRDWLSEATGLRHDGREWFRTTTPDDVAEVVRRWDAWKGATRNP